MKRLLFLLLLLLLLAMPALAATNVSGTISADTTWTVAGSPYILSGDVKVGGSASPTLTIEPGVVVKANAGAHFLINWNDKGALVANGTAQDPILFTANNATSAGHWLGLRFGSVAGGPPSSISYITVEYAGSSQHAVGGISVAGGAPSMSNVTSQHHQHAGIKIEAGSPSIASSVIQAVAGAGLYTNGGTVTLTGVSFLSNTGAAVSMSVTTQLEGLTALTATGNGTNGILVRGDVLPVSRTWRTSSLPYFVSNSVHVKGPATPILTIEAGNTIRFNANSQLLVNYEDKGGLAANGTSSAPILFTSSAASPAPAAWWGLYVGDIAGNTPTSITWATVEYGGVVSSGRGGLTIHASTPVLDHVTLRNNAYAGVSVHGGGVSITDSTLTANSGAGLYGVNAASISLANTAFTNNTGYAISAHANTSFPSVSNITASGNGAGKDAIEMRGGDITANRTWRTISIPYVVNGGIHVKASSAPVLTIEPGNTIRFNSASQIAANWSDKGGLAANGTASAPILFTSNSASPVAGSWWGLYFGEVAGNTPSSLSYATIEYGGYPAAQRGGVTIHATAPVFDHVTIRNSAYAGAAIHGAGATFTSSAIETSGGPGIYGLNPATLTLTDTAFTNNGGYALTLHANTTFTGASGLSASGNGTGRDAIEIRQGVIGSNRTWPAPSIPYVITGNLDVQGSAAPVLTIAAGNTIKFNGGAQIAINHSDKGGLRANGTASEPILFTSNGAQTQNAWLGIWFGPASGAPQSNLTYATIEYGGSSYWSRGGITTHTVTPLFDHVTVRQNQHGGIVINGGAPVIRDSVIASNGGPGINVTAAAGLALTDDAFTSNNGYAVTLPASVPLTEGSGLTASGNGTGKDAIEYRQGVITANRTWPAAGIPYAISGNLDVQGAAAPVLTIAAGTTIRFNAGAQMAINHGDKGGLVANGTPSAPILFTSNGTATPGSWLGLWFGPAAAPPQSSISYATIEYGGSNGASRGGITVNAASPQFDHLTLRDNQYAGFAAAGSASARITNAHLLSNPYGMRSSGPAVIQAGLNYWSAAAGPCVPGNCASGQQSVSGSGVQYEPWLLSAPTDPQFLSSAVQKNRVFSPAIGAATIVDYTTALAGDVAVTIRDASSTAVRTFNTSGTTGQFSWDGKNGSGAVQPDGTYTFELASTAVSQPPAAIARGLAVIDSTRTLTLTTPAVSQPFFSPNGDSNKDTTTVTATTNYDGGAWTVTVLDAGNNTVRTVSGNGTDVSYTWDGRNASNVVQADGVYTLRVDASVGTASAQGNAGAALDNTPPSLTIATPAANEVLSNIYANGSTTVIPTGSVLDTNLLSWTFDIGVGASPTSWGFLNGGSAPVNNGNLASWNTADQPNGAYGMRLVSSDKAGNTTVLVRSPLTLGNFKMTQSAFQFNVATGGTVTYTSTVPFALTQSIVVKNEAGTVVRTLQTSVARAAGTYQDTFSGRNDANVLLSDGPYFYVSTVTAGSSSYTWDLTGVFRNDYSAFNDGLGIQAYDPFNNKPMKFSYNFQQPGRVHIATKTTPGSIIGDCAQPTASFFCPVIAQWQESGPKTFTWSGIDHTGKYRTIRSAAIVTATSEFPKNAALMYGARAKVENVKVTPPVFGPMTGTQAIEFDLSTYQSQPADVTIALINLSTVSTLRTLTLPAQAAGHVTVTWDGRADNGMLVAPGFYRVLVTATDAQGNVVPGDILTTIQY
jgi:flagellar hook assembly protein FlgD